MPFTPFHFGLNVLPGLASGNRLDLLALLGANVAIDIEPLVVITWNLRYPLHGYAHTLAGGLMLGLAVGLGVRLARPVAAGIYRVAGLPQRVTWAGCLLGGAVGGLLHIAFDTLIYVDMDPAFPLRGNPVAGTLSYAQAEAVGAVGLLVAALVYLVVLAVRRRLNRT